MSRFEFTKMQALGNDFIVLDTDLLACAPDAIPRTQVLRTYLGGKLVYARDAPGR